MGLLNLRRSSQVIFETSMPHWLALLSGTRTTLFRQSGVHRVRPAVLKRQLPSIANGTPATSLMIAGLG